MAVVVGFARGLVAGIGINGIGARREVAQWELRVALLARALEAARSCQWPACRWPRCQCGSGAGAGAGARR